MAMLNGKPATLPDDFSVAVFASGLRSPRGLLVAPSGDVLVIERSGVNCVTILWDDNFDGESDASERASCVASAPSLNHGLAMFGGYLFASSSTTVYRWNYNGYQRSALSGRRIVIQNIAYGADGSDLGAQGGHTTRTLAFNDAGRLFVSVGSRGNVDATPFRSRVRVFDGTSLPNAEPIDFNTGQVWADGLRNEVGLAFDAQGVLWGVENGADNLFHPVMGDIHNENPGEELNKLDRAGAFFGYPYCWSEHTLPATYARGQTEQWAWPGFESKGYSDSWCRNRSNVVRPAMVMEAHTAPLGIAFVGARMAHLPEPPPCEGEGGGLPCAWNGDAIVAQHGSWNRNPAVGYAVVRLSFQQGAPTGESSPVLAHGGSTAKWGDYNFRPVDVRSDLDGRLIVSSDTSGEIVRLSYRSTAPLTPPPPAAPPAPACMLSPAQANFKCSCRFAPTTNESQETLILSCST